MNLTHDTENNVAYLSLVEGAPKSVLQKVVEVSGGSIIIDIDDEGAVIGIEFLGARTLLRHTIESPAPQPIPSNNWQ